jgi:geranylgeranyl diphosphate synthase type I
MTGERGLALEAQLPGGRELMKRVLEYALRGKMLRGALVHLGAELFEAATERGIDETAAAMELFQAGLLVHDDIMDRDELRRGAPSFHSRYALEAKAEGAEDPVHLGESLGICAGDVCLFEGFAALAAAVAGAGEGGAVLLALCAEELSVVGLAQMRDCRWASLPLEPGEEEILAMYRGKTARYSFSLPLAAGALLAGRADLRSSLFEIGELAGLAFQVRDDELGLYGDPSRTGKSVVSDIREGKKTLYRARLMARAGEAERGRLAAIYGSPAAGEAEAAFVRDLLETSGVRAEIAAWRDGLARRAKTLAESMKGADPERVAVLTDLIDYLVSRAS